MPLNPSPAEHQAPGGAVNKGTTPKVGYSYADGAANTVRAVGLEYPDGRQLEYNYGAAGGDGDRWSLAHNFDIDATYRYDAFNRRVTKLVDSTERHFYYTASWQCLEERVNSSTDPDRQYIWGLRYIDDLILRDRDTNANGTLDERLYALQDANWNVTAICNASGQIQERYAYTPYGVPTILAPNFTIRGASDYAWNTLYAGYRWDGESSFYNVRHRLLHARLGRWLTNDPLSLLTGVNQYLYANSSPSRYSDPTGLASVTFNPRHVENMPWQIANLGDNVLGLTVATFRMICSCSPCNAVHVPLEIFLLPCAKFKKSYFQCQIIATFEILIDIVHIEWENDVLRQKGQAERTRPGVYGHEQLHIVNVKGDIQAHARRIAQIEKDTACTLSSAQCTAFTNKLAGETLQMIKEFQETEQDHKNPGSPGKTQDFTPVNGLFPERAINALP